MVWDKIDLYRTITCGQIFRYNISDNIYTLFLDDRVVKLIIGNKVDIRSSNMNNVYDKVVDYLDLDRDYDSINNDLLKDNCDLESVIHNSKGFKIMHTPKLETIISYMISANNTVKNISRCVNLMCERYGTKVLLDEEYYLFPSLDVLKKLTIHDFNNLKLGFRSKYIYEFIQKITIEDINNIDNMSTSDALKYLCSFKGIGLKIASCILLFGYKRLDTFPIDTWVKKYMKDKYNIEGINKIENYALNHYKNYSGLVLQYMFNDKRNI